jgi:hypothetical protein
MNKSKAIKQYCLECSGESPKEVTLCHIVDCPLWQFRFGYSIKDKRFKKRIEAAQRKYPEEYREMLQILKEYGENMPYLPEYVQIHAVLAKKITKEGNSSHASITASK